MADSPNETTPCGGCGATEAAHRRFEAVRQTWNCKLFVMVARG